MPNTISLAEYKMFYPDTAEYPTLSQSGMLGLLLERRRHQAVCAARRQARREARRQAVRSCLARWRAKLGAAISRETDPVFASVARNE